MESMEIPRSGEASAMENALDDGPGNGGPRRPGNLWTAQAREDMFRRREAGETWETICLVGNPILDSSCIVYMAFPSSYFTRHRGSLMKGLSWWSPS